MYIKPIENHSDAAYQELAAQSGSVFNSPGWLSMYGKALCLFGIYTDEHELSGAFFLYRSKKGFFSFYKNPPYTPHNGCFFENKAQNVSKALSQNKKITELLAAYMDKLPAGVISTAFPFQLRDMQPFTWKKFKVVPQYTYRLSLAAAAGELEKRMSAEHRNHLKKANKDGITAERITGYSLVRQLVLKTFDRKNKGIDTNLLDSILSKFANDSNSFAFAAFDKGKPVAGCLCIYDQHTSYYLLSGYDPELKHSGAGILCLWNSILCSKEKGHSVFDFEGSMLPEVERFFRGFGADLVPYYSVNKAFLPLEFILKLVKRELF